MTELISLSKTELNEMSDVMSDAFITHSNFRYLIPHRRRRKKAMFHLFKMMYRVINLKGYIFVVSHNDEVAGYITFMDESKGRVNLASVLKTNGILDLIMFLFFSGVRSLLKFSTYMNLYGKYDHGERDHTIHLYAVGIKQRYKGQGIMKQPFLNTFEYFKELGYSVVALETSDPDNVGLYSHLGFNIVKIVEEKSKKQTIYFFELDLTEEQ
jgi:ribosomal protein S18 acetylase RimI-like enzyme